MHRLLLCLVLFCSALHAQTLRINSEPSGASLEIEGRNVGVTPFEKKVPGGFFHQTATVFGKRLNTPVTVTVTLKGYVTRTVELTKGPFPWVALNGTNHGSFYLLKQDQFDIRLTPVDAVFKTAPQFVQSSLAATYTVGPALALEDLVQKVSDSVLYIETADGSGSGFLVTPDGIVVTNKHVVGNFDHVTAKNVNGQTFNGSVVYRDADVDLALIKVDVDKTPFLHLAPNSSVRVGQDAIAIGNPSQGMQNTVTKGIVSGIGPEPNFGPGTFIQTDAAINPGNSGGPLLNRTGDVIGMNTLKAVRSASGSSLQSIGFAISEDTISSALAKVFPNSRQVEASHLQMARLHLTSTATDGEIYIDGKFVGNIGSLVSLSQGDHIIEVKSAEHGDWKRSVTVNGADEISMNANIGVQNIPASEPAKVGGQIVTTSTAEKPRN